MQALAERPKIKTDTNRVPSTTGIVLGYSCSFSSPRSYDIDCYTDLFASGSTQITRYSLAPRLSSKATFILSKLYSFTQLNEDWDSNGALAPDIDLIVKASRFLVKADEYDLPIYFSAPGPNGEIVLEYKNDNNSAELFFENNNISEMLLYRGKELVYSGDINLANLITHLS